VYASDSSGSGWDDEEFVVDFKRASVFSGQNFGPEPVRSGGTVTGTATLKRASWDDNAYHGVPAPPVLAQFRTATGQYATVKTVTGDSAGKVTAAATQKVDGCWRFSFAGYSTTTASTPAGDCVDSY